MRPPPLLLLGLALALCGSSAAAPLGRQRTAGEDAPGGGATYVFLDDCDATNKYHQWTGEALLGAGKPSPVANVGSGGCLTTLQASDTEPTQVAPCSASSVLFSLSRETSQLANGTVCLDVNHGYGPDLTIWPCHPLGDASLGHQQFSYDADMRLLRALGPAAGGLCVTVQPLPAPPARVQLPRLNIDRSAVITTGGSSGGDFAIQVHVAFSASVSGACGYGAQPYRCAITRFARDNLVPASASSSVPNCDGCPPDLTLVYDRCKNHAQWVDVGKLPDFIRRVGAGIDDFNNLSDATVFAIHLECETYGSSSVANTIGMYAQLVTRPDTQLKYEDWCVPGQPHPDDEDEECLLHVLGPGSKAGRHREPLKPPAKQGFRERIFAFEQSPHLDDYSFGFADVGYLYVPEACQAGSASAPRTGCGLILVFHGCGAGKPFGPRDTLVRYAESNGFVVMAPVIAVFNNASELHENANEIGRGCWDGYGQLTFDYVLQSAPHMRNVWRMVQHLMAGAGGGGWAPRPAAGPVRSFFA